MEACLKKTNVKLELLTDIDKVLLFEKWIRGGIAQSIQRYASANNAKFQFKTKEYIFIVCTCK